MRHTGEQRELPQESSRVRLGAGSQDEEDVLRLGGCRWAKDAAWSRKVEGSVRMVEEEPPTGGADEPRNRRAATIDELIRLELAVAHGVHNAATIELVATLA